MAVVLGSLLSVGTGHAAVDIERLADSEKAFQDARAAIDAGDVEGGIVALERLLLVQPGLGNIQFELGLLYVQVGARERAKFYLTKSMKNDDMPVEVRRRAEAELANLDVAVSRHTFFGRATLRVQSDTNPGADSTRKQFVDLVAGPVEADSDRQAESDASLHGGLNADYRIRVNDSTGWSVGGGVSASGYREQDNLDEQRLFARTGFDHRLQEGSDTEARVDFRPQLRYSTTRRDGDRYGDVVGVSLGLRVSEPGSSKGVAFSASMLSFEASGNQGKEGTRLSLDGHFGAALGASLYGRIDYDVGISNRDAGFESYRRAGARASLSRRFSTGANRPLTLTGGVSLATRAYDDPDLSINPDSTRSDTSPGASLSLSVPLSRGFTIRGRASYVDNRSNIPNYDYDNTQFSVGTDWTF